MNRTRRPSVGARRPRGGVTRLKEAEKQKPGRKGKKSTVQFHLLPVPGKKRSDSRVHEGNSCKESTRRPNIRRYTDTRCQERTRWHDRTVTYTLRPGFIHHPVEMQFPLFLPEKLLGPSPRHVPQIKPATLAPRSRYARLSPSEPLLFASAAPSFLRSRNTVD